MKRLGMLLVALTVGIGCSEPGPTGESRISDSTQAGPALAYTPPPGKCRLSPRNPSPGDCASVSVTMSPYDRHCTDWDCFTPQLDPIHAVFSKRVYQVDVIGSGAFLAPSPNLGTIEYYSHGALVHSGPMATDSGDFGGEDSITGQVFYMAQWLGGIDSLIIYRPEPDSFLVTWLPPEQGQPTGHTKAEYTFFLFDKRPATAANCLTGDELLDQQATRDFLKLLWDSSSTGLAPSLRRESGGYLFEDSTGTIVSRTYFDRANDTPCENNNTPQPPFPGVFVAGGHSHPFLDREQLPNNCRRGPAPPGYIRQYDARTYGGPSAGDIDRTTDDGLPMYIVDSLNVYAMPVGTTRANALSMVKTYARRDTANACTRL